MSEKVVLTAQAWERTKAGIKAIESMPRDRTGAPRRQGQSSGGVVWVEVTEPATGHGKYLGKIVLPPTADITQSADTEDADLGDTDDGEDEGEDILIFNVAEAGADTWTLAAGTRLQGTIRQENEDGKLVVAVAPAAVKKQLVRCVDDYGHAQFKVSVKNWTGSAFVGDAYDIDIIHHTTVHDVFYVIDGLQQGYPTRNVVGMVLQRMGGSTPHSIDWDFMKGHS